MDNISNRDKALVKNSVRSAIRKSFSRSDHYKGFLKSRRIEWRSGKRRRVSYECQICLVNHPSTNINVDHKVPLGKGVYGGLEDADSFSALVYCSWDNLQILCRECHKLKTKEEQKAPSFHNAIF